MLRPGLRQFRGATAKTVQTACQFEAAKTMRTGVVDRQLCRVVLGEHRSSFRYPLSTCKLLHVVPQLKVVLARVVAGMAPCWRCVKMKNRPLQRSKGRSVENVSSRLSRENRLRGSLPYVGTRGTVTGALVKANFAARISGCDVVKIGLIFGRIGELTIHQVELIHC